MTGVYPHSEEGHTRHFRSECDSRFMYHKFAVPAVDTGRSVKKIGKLVAGDGEGKGHQVERVDDCKVTDGVVFILVKWRGWGEQYRTWEPSAGCRVEYLLSAFFALNRGIEAEVRSQAQKSKKRKSSSSSSSSSRRGHTPININPPTPHSPTNTRPTNILLLYVYVHTLPLSLFFSLCRYVLLQGVQ